MKKEFLLILAIFCLQTVILFAEDEDITNALPLILSKQNAGTEFFITFHPCWEEKSDNNFVRIYVSSRVETKVTLEITGLNYSQTQKSIANGVIEFKLTPAQAQMYSKTDAQSPEPAQEWKSRAIHITAEDPVIVYGVTKYMFNSEGFLAIPSSSLGTNYIVSSWADPSDNKTQWLPSYTSIIGVYDNTLVTFVQGGDLQSGKSLFPDFDTLKAGQNYKATLNKGDVFLIPSIGKYSDLTNSQVIANKPVACISGNYCAYIPQFLSNCNYTIEQELPSSMSGSKYHVTPIATRLRNPWLNIFASKDNTNLYKDGFEAGTIIKSDPYTKKFFQKIADKFDLRALAFSSDPGFPIKAVLCNPGPSEDGIIAPAFQMNLIPTDLYQNEIMFSTPGIDSNGRYSRNYINLTYKANSLGNIPDDLEIGTGSNGQILWEQLNLIDGNSGYMIADFDPSDGRQYKSKTILLPASGTYFIRSNDKFIAYSYGFGDYDSYGFPANFDSRSLDKIETLKPTLDVTFNNGKEIQGYIYDEPRNSMQNSSKLSNVYLLNSRSSNFKFFRDEIVTGQTTKVLWSLRPIKRTSDAKALIVAKDYAGNDTIYKIVYTGVPSAINPPIKSSPVDSAFGLPNNIKLIWNSVKNATNYTLEISDNLEFIAKIKVVNNIQDTFALVNNFVTDSKYFWRVIAFNSSDTSDYSSIWQFETIITVPASPVLLAPVNDTTNQSYLLLFNWKSSINTVLYTLEIDNNNDFSSIFKTVDTKDTFVTINDFDRNTKYYWRVKAQNSTGKFAYSSVRNFVTGNFIATTPILLYPDVESKNVITDVIFRWTSNQWLSDYQIQIIDNTQSGEITIDKQISDTTFSTRLNQNTVYYWRVKALNKYGISQWSFMRSFQTENNTSVNAQEPQYISKSPNPAKDNFEVNYNLVQDSKVRIELFDLNGIEMAELINQFQSSGSYKLNYNCSKLPIGTYLLKMSINEKTFIEKVAIER